MIYTESLGVILLIKSFIILLHTLPRRLAALQAISIFYLHHSSLHF